MRPIQLVRLAALLALAIALAPLAWSTLAAQQDYTCYYTFTPRDDPSVELKTCEYEGGGSGFTELINKTDTDMEVCWTPIFENEETPDSEGCRLRLPAGEHAKSSCYACSRRGTSGGVYDVKFTKLNLLNEKRR